jgi:hypothetical protein
MPRRLWHIITRGRRASFLAAGILPLFSGDLLSVRRRSAEDAALGNTLPQSGRMNV